MQSLADKAIRRTASHLSFRGQGLSYTQQVPKTLGIWWKREPPSERCVWHFHGFGVLLLEIGAPLLEACVALPQ